MRGRQVFMDSLRAHGVEKIFGNPGTTENPLLDSLLDYPDIDYVVALHEGIAVSAASFYAQAANKPAVVNLHVAPGLGNGIGAIFGALKANSPLVVTAGQQDTRMRLRDPLLGHDLVAMAAPVTKYAAQPNSADELAPMLQRAFKIACEPPCGPVFVALPINVMEQETVLGAQTMGHAYDAVTPDAAGLAQLRDLLAGAQAPAIIAGDQIARSGGFHTLVLLAEQLGAPVFNEPLRTQLAFPNRHPSYAGRMALDIDAMRPQLAGFDLVVMIGGVKLEEVWFDTGTPFAVGAKLVQIETSRAQLAHNYAIDLGLYGDLAETLSLAVAQIQTLPASFKAAARARNDALAEKRSANAERASKSLEKIWHAQPMAPARALAEIANALPDNAIVVDESITASVDLANTFDFANPGDYFGGRGGGIGQGIAGAIGAAVAYPDRPIALLSGDGSAMYAIQSLWSASHHELPIVFIILSNREYRVLKHNMDVYRARFATNSNKPYPEMDLTKPLLGFAEMAAGMGVDAHQITDAEQISEQVRAAFASGKPTLIDIVVSGKEYGMQ